MSLDSIIGQPLAVSLCRQWLQQKTNHPLLFYGPEGVGKRALALETAKALNCAAQNLEACGQCRPCKKIAAGLHPDARVLDLNLQATERDEPLAKQQALRIETVLAERHRLLQSAVEGPWKITIIDDAHRLTPDAANVLLKILEEPPARTALFLLTPFRDRLFATLVSRCQPVRFRPLSDEEMQSCLMTLDVPEETRVRLIELALGSPGRALHLSREEQIKAAAEAEELWLALPRHSPADLISKFEGRAKSAKVSRAEIEDRIHSLMRPAVRSLRAGEIQATEPVRLLEDALKKLRQNVQPALVYDHLLLRLAASRQSVDQGKSR